MYQINEDITLVPYYPNEKVALEWYQDLELCKQVDNIDFVYDLPRRCINIYLPMEIAIIFNIKSS